jgi:hypothetical protein
MKKLVKFGNFKIPKSTMVFNIGTATRCAALKLGLCKVGDACYALQSERQYPAVKSYRERQAYFWNNNSAEDIAEYFIEQINKRKLTVSLIRFNESGDFNTQDDVYKMMKVAEIIYCKTLIKSYVYTARKDLWLPNNDQYLTINGSGFMVSNEFKVISFGESLSSVGADVECPQDCTRCALCAYSHGLNIVVRPHGTKKNKLSKKLKDG